MNVLDTMVVVAKGWGDVRITAIRSTDGAITGYDSTGAALSYPVTTTRITGTAYSYRTVPILIPTTGKYVVSMSSSSGETQEQVITVGGTDDADALSEDEKARIRMYLGYSAQYRQTYYVLEGAMVAIQDDSAEIVLIREMLVDLDDIDTKIRTSRGRQTVKSADNVVMAGREELKALRSEGQMVAERLARLLGVSCLGGAFGSAGVSSGYLR